MSDKIHEPNVYELLERNGFVIDHFFDGFKNEKTGDAITHRAIYMWPGDVRYYLLTGYCRNIHIFDANWFQPTPESLGYKAHKDGRCVKIRRIK